MSTATDDLLKNPLALETIIDFNLLLLIDQKLCTLQNSFCWDSQVGNR